METQFFKDLSDGLNKIKEITIWLIDTVMLGAGKEAHQHREKEKNVVIVENSQKESTQNLITKGVDNTMRKNCYQRTDGRWQYSKQQNGFLYYAIANTYRELLEKIKQIKPRQIRHVKNTKTKIVTFLQYFNFYIDNYVRTKDIKEHTKSIWYIFEKKYIAPNFQRIQLDKLSTEDIQRFINSIKLERTREMLFQTIVRVLKKAYVTGKIKKDITLGLERPKRKEKQQRPPLTYDEQKRLLEEVRGSQIEAFVLFSIIVGSRREETIRFNFDEDIDYERCEIHIKGTKTVSSDRKVIVTKQFLDYLKENVKKKFKHEADYYSKKLRDVYRKLGITNCLHGLRHTCAANLYFLGAQDKYRQMQLGHSSIVTTNDIYTNIVENIPKAKVRELYGDLYPTFD